MQGNRARRAGAGTRAPSRVVSSNDPPRSAAIARSSSLIALAIHVTSWCAISPASAVTRPPPPRFATPSSYVTGARFATTRSFRRCVVRSTTNYVAGCSRFTNRRREPRSPGREVISSSSAIVRMIAMPRPPSLISSPSRGAGRPGRSRRRRRRPRSASARRGQLVRDGDEAVAAVVRVANGVRDGLGQRELEIGDVLLGQRRELGDAAEREPGERDVLRRERGCAAGPSGSSRALRPPYPPAPSRSSAALLSFSADSRFQTWRFLPSASSSPSRFAFPRGARFNPRPFPRENAAVGRS